MGGGVKTKVLTAFTRQLAWLLQAGTTLNRSLEILSGEAFSKPLAEAIVEVRGAIRKGRSFHDALEDAGAFPPFYLSMVEVGEATGTLASVLDRLATSKVGVSGSGSVKTTPLGPSAIVSSITPLWTERPAGSGELGSGM